MAPRFAMRPIIHANAGLARPDLVRADLAGSERWGGERADVRISISGPVLRASGIGVDAAVEKSRQASSAPLRPVSHVGVETVAQVGTRPGAKGRSRTRCRRNVRPGERCGRGEWHRGREYWAFTALQ